MTEETDASATRKRRSRGTGFPSLSLSDAASAISTIAMMGKDLTKEQAASYLGHTTVNSGAFAVKYAALRDYGLLTGRGDDLEVTPLGMQIAHPESPSAREEALRQAFFRSDIFSSVYSTLHPGAELQKEHVAAKAMHQFGVSPQSKSNFIDAFVDSAETAGLVEVVDSERFRVRAPEADPVLQPQTDAEQSGGEADVPTTPPTEKRVEKAAPTRSAQPPVVHHLWSLENGGMLFQITVSGSLPAPAYGKIQSIIEQGDELARMLGVADPADGSATAKEEVMS